MERHPIPRQITTFEFKLIGFLTLKQFLYLIAFILVGAVLFFIFPIPIINVVMAVGTALIGVVLAFVPIYNRPADQVFKDFINAIRSPTQFVYKKDNQPIYFLDKLVFAGNPHILVSHIKSNEKLTTYLQKKPVTGDGEKNAKIHHLLSKPSLSLHLPFNKKSPPPASSQSVLKTPPTSSPPKAAPAPLSTHKPFLIGVVKNNRKISLPGILIYIKDDQGKIVRLLKTNPHGSFATFQPLPPANYLVEAKDPSGSYFFDTMNLSVTDNQLKKLEFISKEML